MSSRPRLSSIFAASTAASTTTTVAASPSRPLPPAYAAFQERLRSGTLGPDDARQLFDELLLRRDDPAPAPAPARAISDILAALARAPPSAACSDGPALAVELFKRMDRWACPHAAADALTIYTYNILIDCYRRMHRPELALAVFGRLLRTGLESYEEADNLFISVEKSGRAPDSRLLNHIVRMLLKKAEVAKASNYLSIIDENNLTLEASTISLLASLFSREDTQGEPSETCLSSPKELSGSSNKNLQQCAENTSNRVSFQAQTKWTKGSN
ncbi:hypothetical protein OsI_15458 [Oryza sativa Indica Group]|uniref:Uncharacterized protein n=1 Tax=Oryza sativa subsp. indica TaxID=39946 RepID=B8ASI5_ORYSI|nr:hypothetical protein OsI_15458 [Oryza sativa Indica Group]